MTVSIFIGGERTQWANFAAVQKRYERALISTSDNNITLLNQYIRQTYIADSRRDEDTHLHTENYFFFRNIENSFLEVFKHVGLSKHKLENTSRPCCTVYKVQYTFIVNTHGKTIEDFKSKSNIVGSLSGGEMLPNSLTAGLHCCILFRRCHV